MKQPMPNYWDRPHLREITAWLRAKGFIESGSLLVICWSDRIGMESTSLEFWPHNKGCDAIVGHHASGTNPRMCIGTCETVADVEMVCETIRKINGFKEPEPYWSPKRLDEAQTPSD